MKLMISSIVPIIRRPLIAAALLLIAISSNVLPRGIVGPIQNSAAQLSTVPCSPPLSPETKREMEARLSEARARFESNPNDVEAHIWLGRRTAYLGRFDEAIAIYSTAIGKFPADARLYRHRGHRYLSLRRFELAIEDLKRAARIIKGKTDEIEPDGLPNARNIPTSTLQSNIWYHLGLAYYLTNDFKSALQAYREGLKVSKNPDMLSATTHWLYMTLRRLNREKEANAVLSPIKVEMDIIENRDYHRLLLMYQGKLQPESLLEEAGKSGSMLSFPSTAYGVGNWYLYNGRRDAAVNLFRKILEGTQCSSFGFIAAEAELKRLASR